MSTNQQLYDPHHPGVQVSTGPPPPQYQPAPPTYQPGPGYYPVPPQPVSTNNTTVAVVNTAPSPAICAVVTSYPPPTYMVLNIITLLFCCFIFGLIGVFYSIQVESEWSQGNRAGALSASRTARNWGIAGILTGTFSVVGFFVFGIIMGIVNGASSSANE